MSSVDYEYEDYLFNIAFTFLEVAQYSVIPSVFIGGIITLIVYQSKELCKQNSIRIYYCAHAVVDFIHIIVRFLTLNDSKVALFLQTTVFCQTIYLIYEATQFLHVYIIIFATIDRLLFIALPNKLTFIRKNWFPWLIIGIFVVISIALYTPYAINIKYMDYYGRIGCYLLTEFYTKYVIIRFVFNAAIPLVIMFYSTIHLIIIVRKSKEKFKQQKKDDTKSKTQTTFAGNILTFDIIVFISIVIRYSTQIAYTILTANEEYYANNYGKVDLIG
jgi:hypothetical protein